MRESLRPYVACPDCLGAMSFETTKAMCRSCRTEYPLRRGAVFFRDAPDQADQEDSDYARDKASWSAFKRKNHAFIERATSDLSRTSAILDLGAGPGFFDDILARFEAVLSADFCPFPNIDVVTDIVTRKIPIRKGSMDCVILSNVLEHVSRPERLLAECRRVLKDSGRLVGITPFMFKIHQAPYDFCRYTHFKLDELLTEAGFTHVSIEKMGTLLDVLDGVKFEYKQLLGSDPRPLLLRQLLRVQFHLDKLIQQLYLRKDDARLANGDVFVGYSFTAGCSTSPG